MNSDKQVNVNGVAMSYHAFVEALIAKFPDSRLELCHAAMGVAGEAGELCDAIKKSAIYGKDLDRKNVVEELGDLNFYMQDLQNKFFISDAEILNHNAEKLAKRYKTMTFTAEAAILRADKTDDHMEAEFVAAMNAPAVFPTKLAAMGYTEEELEKDNPYNEWNPKEEIASLQKQVDATIAAKSVCEHKEMVFSYSEDKWKCLATGCGFSTDPGGVTR